MNRQTTAIRITHSWCPICQAHPTGKARCGTPRGLSIWPAGAQEQACLMCSWLEPRGCEWCGGDR